MQFIIDSHERSFRNREFLLRDPLYLYPIACACEFEEQVKYLASNAELSTITRYSDAGDPKGLAVDSYYNLVSFVTRRDTVYPRVLKS